MITAITRLLPHSITTDSYRTPDNWDGLDIPIDTPVPGCYF